MHLQSSEQPTLPLPQIASWLRIVVPRQLLLQLADLRFVLLPFRFNLLFLPVHQLLRLPDLVDAAVQLRPQFPVLFPLRFQLLSNQLELIALFLNLSILGLNRAFQRSPRLINLFPQTLHRQHELIDLIFEVFLRLLQRSNLFHLFISFSSVRLCLLVQLLFERGNLSDRRGQRIILGSGRLEVHFQSLKL